MLQDQQGKWMKVMNMKVAVEDNHVETMAGYKLAAEDTLTSTFEFRVQVLCCVLSHTKFQSQPQVSLTLVSVPALADLWLISPDLCYIYCLHSSFLHLIVILYAWN